MKKMPVVQLDEGMVLAETIYSPNGKVLLAEGTALNKALINRLQEMQVLYVSVNDEDTVAIDPNMVLLSRVTDEANNLLATFLPINLEGERHAAVQERYDKSSKILNKVLRLSEVNQLYLDLRTTDDETLSHCVSVCVLSLIMGVVLDLNATDLYNLGIGAMLHDIGKKMVPPAILSKKQLDLRETALFQNHTQHGFQIMRNAGLPHEVAKVALYHHERWDGSGYPQRLRGENIDLLSRIVMVADVYDDCIRGLTYDHKYLPHEAIEYLYGAGNFYFDARVVKAFTQTIAPYPLGSIVRLSTGEIGIVVNVAKTTAPRPIVKICYDKNNQRLQYPRQVDLSEETTLFITKILW